VWTSASSAPSEASSDATFARVRERLSSSAATFRGSAPSEPSSDEHPRNVLAE